MTDPRRPDDPPPRHGGDQGGDAAWGPSPWLLVAAVGIAAGTLAWWWTARPAPPAGAPPSQAPARVAEASAMPSSAPRLLAVPTRASAPERPAPPRPVAAAAPAASLPPLAGRHIVRRRDAGGDQTPDLADYVNDGAIPTMAQVIDQLHQRGIYTGLGAFNPPGTRPPLVGLAVPEGFVLPEGYVRHYQATDDGQRIEPILMFSPDYQFYDAQHRPVAVPANRVVPPELAPPGMPVRRVVIPAPLAPPDPSVPAPAAPPGS